MPTGEKRVNFFYKKLISWLQMRDNLFYYLIALFESVVKNQYPNSGIWSPDPLNLSAGSTTGTFDVASGQAVTLQDNAGHVLGLPITAGDDIPFENANGVDYYVGAKYCQIPDETEQNPRYNNWQWGLLRDAVGEQDDPDSVAIQGAGLKFVINSVTESGVDHSGRTARVWIKTPEGGSAYEEKTIQYSAGDNFIVTDGILGQVSASLTASDYGVALEGYTWKRNTDLSTQPEYAYLGTVQGKTGVPPDTFDMTGQNFLRRTYGDSDFLNLLNAFKLEHDYDPGAGDHTDITVNSISGKADASIPVNVDSSLTLDIDHDNDETDREFKVTHDDGAETLLQVKENGDVLDKNGSSLGGWLGSPTRIKLLPSMFGSDTDEEKVQADGAYTELLGGGNSLVATVEIPKGFKATAIKVWGTGTGTINVVAYESDIDLGTSSSLASGVAGTEFSISLTADDTNYLVIAVSSSGTTAVWGGYVTIEKV